MLPPHLPLTVLSVMGGERQSHMTERQWPRPDLGCSELSPLPSPRACLLPSPCCQSSPAQSLETPSQGAGAICPNHLPSFRLSSCCLLGPRWEQSNRKELRFSEVPSALGFSLPETPRSPVSYYSLIPSGCPSPRSSPSLRGHSLGPLGGH